MFYQQHFAYITKLVNITDFKQIHCLKLNFLLFVHLYMVVVVLFTLKLEVLICEAFVTVVNNIYQHLCRYVYLCVYITFTFYKLH